MLGRRAALREVRTLLRRHPAVAILGPRQVGKTTLARAVASAWTRGASFFDLERRRDLERLDDPETALEPLRGLVVIDEIQRRPDLFGPLRPLCDRPGTPARFLVLGSASPGLLAQSAESLAGRIAYFDLPGLGIADVTPRHWRKLWARGGFPRSYLAPSDAESFRWRGDLIRTFLARDLPDLGFTIAPATLERFWGMLAHYHGQIWRGAELARAFGISESTVRRYLDILRDTFMVRVLPAWSENVGKRVVKSPKVYLADSGMLHALLDLRDVTSALAHPKVGASFEGFALDEIVRRLGAGPRECFFWATHQGAELDLLVIRGRRRLGFEFKHTVSPGATRSMHIAVEDLGLDRLDVIHVGRETYPLTAKIRAVAIERVTRDVAPLA